MRFALAVLLALILPLAEPAFAPIAHADTGPQFAPGNRVIVINGPYTGFHGTVQMIFWGFDGSWTYLVVLDYGEWIGAPEPWLVLEGPPVPPPPGTGGGG